MSNAVLIYPPVTDPTSGYHSLAYIDSYARAQGYPAADVIDANIEAFHYSFSEPGVEWLTAELARAANVDDETYGGYIDPEEARAHRLRVGSPDPDGVREAVRILQDPELFFRVPEYRRAVDAVTAWMNCLGATGFPGQFRNGFTVRLPRAVDIGTAEAVNDRAVQARLSRPFQPYYEDVLLPRLVAGGYDVVGVNITYHWQLPFALWLIHLLRAALPDAFIVAGGTEVADVWKYSRRRQTVFEVFDDLDAIVIGEGETAWTAILDAVRDGGPPSGHPNVQLHPRYGVGRALPMLRYEPLRDVPTPDFDNLPWHLYLSPDRFVYYSPTRGCYWNKCTFCDYGLNTDGPTSPWRQSTVDKMIRDVTALTEWGAKFIYFAVDVLAPATILRFAEQVVECGLDIRWGAEIRLEKYWSTERCELLRRSGCVAISVGFESANQRILDLIDKGTRPEQVRQTMEAMTKAGIAVQVMGFTGFPTETVAEAQESIDFLLTHRDLWTFGGLGEFQLTAGAIVAKQPERFGVADVRPLDHSDIARTLRYAEPVTEGARAEVAAAKRAMVPERYDRPWVGGIDAPHSYFYHDRYGTAVRIALTAELDDGFEPGNRFVANGSLVERPAPDTLDAYLRIYQEEERSVPAGQVIFRRRDGNLLAFPPAIVAVLGLFKQPQTLSAATQELWMLGETTARRLLRTLIDQGAIRQCPQRDRRMS
jgi:hypothetical protein